MHVEQSENRTEVRTFFYALELTPDRFTLKDPRTGHTLVDCPTPLIYRPEFAPADLSWSFERFDITAADAGPIELAVSATQETGRRLTITLRCFEEFMEIGCAASPQPTESIIAYWNLLAHGTKLDMFHVHHWRNRYGHNQTYETYNLTQGQRYGEDLSDAPPEMREQWGRLTNFTTYSSDWQFAPRPGFFLMQRDNVMLGLGARDLPHGFGLEMRSASTNLHHLRLNYGGDHGYPVRAKEEAVAPRLYLWLDHNRDIWESTDHYARLLRQDGEISERDNRETPHWWTRPQYCTWQDQCYLAGNSAYYNWMGDTPKGLGPVESFDELMLSHLLDRLEEEKLPVGSIIIDDGWQKQRGEWIAHPERFPKLRDQIDRIHAMGIKALLWFAPLDFWEGAAILARPELLCGGGVLSSHGASLLDYSLPRVQEEYVRPMMRYFFSGEPGCLDADGIKTDFMADKVQPIFPVHNPDWRGEEPFILKTIELLYLEMKSYKPDAMHLGCIAHPAFTGVQNVIRTYDVPASQFQHQDRAIMLRHFAPGNLVSLDLSECRSLADIEQHLEIAFRNNLLYQLPRIAVDPQTGEHPLGPDFFPLLRRKLPAWG